MKITHGNSLQQRNHYGIPITTQCYYNNPTRAVQPQKIHSNKITARAPPQYYPHNKTTTKAKQNNSNQNLTTTIPILVAQLYGNKNMLENTPAASSTLQQTYPKTSL